MTAGLRTLKVEFDTPTPDTAAYYEYTVRSATGTKVRCLPFRAGHAWKQIARGRKPTLHRTSASLPPLPHARKLAAAGDVC